MSEAGQTYRAVVSRDGQFWLIRVPELDIVTQARSVDEIDHMARDLIAVWLEVDPATVGLIVTREDGTPESG
ncbi:type II toxin-antitoxin system HicB family antitoxin [Actinopolymorpha pittospori]|uniref:RNase H-like HicB family nuclease n=1 Tax=Actinopolymorpha pittospori TaxID=648752 RepID=A0A927MXG3_9ACTN|nr:hypothetical protein [Actinopolymorpha pittospori]MBE1608017.1 putative RNase H-like HicB family nuclease [Actinopolymorpha pittospori]